MGLFILAILVATAAAEELPAGSRGSLVSEGLTTDTKESTSLEGGTPDPTGTVEVRPQAQVTYSSWDTSTLSISCQSSTDCPRNQSCEARRCVDRCTRGDVICGQNARCRTVNHISTCACQPLTTGDPFDRCFPIVTESKRCTSQNHCPDHEVCRGYKCVDPCMWCGDNTDCVTKEHRETCTCKRGYVGDPHAGCEKLAGACDAECVGHDHCPATQTCIKGKCSDPCEGSCGPNTMCQVVNHIPTCYCKAGHSGNPITGCGSLKGEECPGGWPPTTNGKKRFYAENEKLAAWHEAWISCWRNNSRLASIDTKDELDMVKAVLRNTGRRSGQFWTSGTDYGDFINKFTWASTGKLVRPDVAEWLVPQPDNFASAEDCIELWEYDRNLGYRWNDRNCLERHYFLCEYYEM